MFNRRQCYRLKQSGFQPGEIRCLYDDYLTNGYSNEDLFVEEAIIKRVGQGKTIRMEYIKWRPSAETVLELSQYGFSEAMVREEAEIWIAGIVLGEGYAIRLNETFRRWFLAKHRGAVRAIEGFIQDTSVYGQHEDCSEQALKLALAELKLEWKGRGRKPIDVWQKLLNVKISENHLYADS